MKRIIALLTLAATASAYSQGAVTFNNRELSANIDEPIYYEVPCLLSGKVNGTNAVPYAGFKFGGIYARAALYAAPAGWPEEYFELFGPVVGFRSGLASGYLASAPNTTRILTNFWPGSPADVQIRAWDCGVDGVNSYEEAMARLAYAGPVILGKSEVIRISALGTSMMPSPLTGLTSFYLFGPLEPIPPPLSGKITNGNRFLLSWLDNCYFYRLHAQTNLVIHDSYSTNWVEVIGASSPMLVPINTNLNVFYRMRLHYGPP